MKSTYFTIHPGKNPTPQNGCWLKSFFFLKHRFHILHFLNSTGLFTKPTGRHYTTYWFSPDIGQDEHDVACFMLHITSCLIHDASLVNVTCDAPWTLLSICLFFLFFCVLHFYFYFLVMFLPGRLVHQAGQKLGRKIKDFTLIYFSW